MVLEASYATAALTVAGIGMQLVAFWLLRQEVRAAWRALRAPPRTFNFDLYGAVGVESSVERDDLVGRLDELDYRVRGLAAKLSRGEEDLRELRGDLRRAEELETERLHIRPRA